MLRTLFAIAQDYRILNFNGYQLHGRLSETLSSGLVNVIGNGIKWLECKVEG